MKHSQLTWEEVTQFEGIKDYGQQIWKHNGQYYFVTDEGGIAEQRVVYELPTEIFKLIESGEKNLVDVHYKLQHDVWPLTEEEKKIRAKERVHKRPITLISNPKNQRLFTQDELTTLIPIAEKKWIEWKGHLPADYVSPLK